MLGAGGGGGISVRGEMQEGTCCFEGVFCFCASARVSLGLFDVLTYDFVGGLRIFYFIFFYGYVLQLTLSIL